MRRLKDKSSNLFDLLFRKLSSGRAVFHQKINEKKMVSTKFESTPKSPQTKKVSFGDIFIFIN